MNSLSKSNEDLEFEIEDEGFDDELCEQVTIGVPAPEDAVMTIYNDSIKVHIIGKTDARMITDPRATLMEILQHADPDAMRLLGVEIQVEEC